MSEHALTIDEQIEAAYRLSELETLTLEEI